jgi:hypothetical protein
MSSNWAFGKNESSLIYDLAKLISANPWLRRQINKEGCQRRGRSIAERQAYDLAKSIGLNRQFSLQEVLGLLIEMSNESSGVERLLVAPPNLLDILPTGYGLKPIKTFLEDILRKAKKEVLLLAPFWEKSTLVDLLRCLPAGARRMDLLLLLVHMGRRTPRIESMIEEIQSTCPMSRIRLYIHIANQTSSTRYPHAKCLVVDGTYSYLGSANFTSAGMREHVELGVSLGSRDSKLLGSILQFLLSKTELFALAWDSGFSRFVQR